MTPLSLLARDLSPPRVEAPPVGPGPFRQSVASWNSDQKALLAKHVVALAALSRGEIAETDASAVEARQFFAVRFPVSAPQAAQTITGVDAEAILKKFGRW
jgi:hypothetical protein